MSEKYVKQPSGILNHYFGENQCRINIDENDESLLQWLSDGNELEVMEVLNSPEPGETP